MKKHFALRCLSIMALTFHLVACSLSQPRPEQACGSKDMGPAFMRAHKEMVMDCPHRWR